jgi:hypothetical protein
MTQSSAPDTVDWRNPAWTADTEALANSLWRLIQIYKNGQAPAIRPPSAAVPPSTSRFQEPRARTARDA